jgi:hypothetical protein
MTELYRHYGPKDELLYVGVSISTLVRLGQHRDCSEWFNKIKRVEIQQFESREKALAAEREAIEKERPHFNVHHKKLPKDESREAPREESKRNLLRRLVYLHPVYSFQGVKDVLGIGETIIRRLIENGKLGFILIPPLRAGEKPRLRITGWQLLEYIEALEKESRCEFSPPSGDSLADFK